MRKFCGNDTIMGPTHIVIKRILLHDSDVI